MWRLRGWDAYRTLYFAIGADAYAVEQDVLRWLRIVLGLPRHLSSGDGASETVSADAIDLPTLWAAVERTAQEYGRSDRVAWGSDATAS